MIRTLDFERLRVAAADVRATAETFRENFGFSIRESSQSGDALRLSVGPAEIEILPARGGPAGLHSLVLRVASLEQARAELEKRGCAPAECEIDGRRAVAVGPAGTNGVRLVLVAD